MTGFLLLPLSDIAAKHVKTLEKEAEIRKKY